MLIGGRLLVAQGNCRLQCYRVIPVELLRNPTDPHDFDREVNGTCQNQRNAGNDAQLRKFGSSCDQATAEAGDSNHHSRQAHQNLGARLNNGELPLENSQGSQHVSLGVAQKMLRLIGGA